MGLTERSGATRRAVRWGLLSTADIARKKVIPAFKKTPRAELVAVASRDGDRARQVASDLGFARHHESYEALLDDPDVEAVYIPLPNHMHLEWTIRAAEAGKHVLCEKPLALTAAEAEQMIAAVRANGVVLMEAFMYRLHPSWVAVREIVASGRIGPLMAVQSWFSYYNDDPANIRNIRAVGGGALYDIGCYCINLSRMLFGGEPLAVKGSIIREPKLDVDIVSSAILEFEAGLATFTCSTRTETDQRVHVYGTAGRISIDIPFNIPPDRPTRIFVTAGGDAPVAPNTQTLTFETADPYTVEAETFAAVVLDGMRPPFPPEDAVANLRVLEQVVSSAQAAN